MLLQVPMLFSTGNHEIEQQSTGEIFRSVMTRWKVHHAFLELTPPDAFFWPSTVPVQLSQRS